MNAPTCILIVVVVFLYFGLSKMTGISYFPSKCLDLTYLVTLYYGSGIVVIFIFLK